MADLYRLAQDTLQGCRVQARHTVDVGLKPIWQRLMRVALAEKTISQRFRFHAPRAQQTTYFKARIGT
jgi:hypothetical protein